MYRMKSIPHYQKDIGRDGLWRGKYIYIQLASSEDILESLTSPEQFRITDDKQDGSRIEIKLENIKGWFRVGRQENILVRYKPSRLCFRFCYTLWAPGENEADTLKNYG